VDYANAASSYVHVEACSCLLPSVRLCIGAVYLMFILSTVSDLMKLTYHTSSPCGAESALISSRVVRRVSITG
jgi:hypothetical protein